MAPSGLQVASLRRRLAAAGINAILLVIPSIAYIVGYLVVGLRRVDARTGGPALWPPRHQSLPDPLAGIAVDQGLTRFDVLEIANLHRRFGDLVALDDVSLSRRHRARSSAWSGATAPARRL